MKIKLPLLLTLFLLLFNSYNLTLLHPVLAQTPTVSSSTTPNGNLQLHGIDIGALIDYLFGKNYPEKLTRFYQSYLPQLPIIPANPAGVKTGATQNTASTVQVQGNQTVGSGDLLYQTAGGYGLSSGRTLPQKIETITTDLNDLFRGITDIIGKGDEEASRIGKSCCPQNTAETVLGTNLAEPLVRSYPLLQCANLPPELCNNNTPGSIAITPLITPSPQETPTPVQLTYDIPFYKTDAQSTKTIDDIAAQLPSKMDIVIPAFVKRWPTSLLSSNWREVFDTSYAQNWNPAFVLAVWIEETAASDACTIRARQGKDGIWDFGVITLPKTYCNDTQRMQRFHDQLTAFLNIVTKISPPLTFEKFMCLYSEGKSAPCVFGTNPGFVQRLKPVYDCLLNPTADVCPSGYFDFGSAGMSSSYTYYSQYDTSWIDKTFPLKCSSGIYNTIGHAGCGPTTLAMILATYKGATNTPSSVVDAYYGGEDTQCDGTSAGEASQTLQTLGFDTEDIFSFYHKSDQGDWVSDPKPIAYVLPVLRNYINAGWMIFAGADYWSEKYDSWVGHFFWITKIDDGGNIWIMDSWKGQNVRMPLIQNTISPQPLYKIAFAFKNK